MLRLDIEITITKTGRLIRQTKIVIKFRKTQLSSFGGVNVWTIGLESKSKRQPKTRATKFTLL